MPAIHNLSTAPESEQAAALHAIRKGLTAHNLDKRGIASGFGFLSQPAGFGIGIAAFGTGIGQGLAINKSVEGIARNPEASGKITVTMLIGLAMIESLCIYALVVALIILYAYPMTKPIAAALGLKV